MSVAVANASIWSAWPPIASWKNSGPGWVVTRLISQESRGTTQVIASGSAPCWTSQTQVSIAVLPPPSTTNRAGARCARPGRAFGGTRSTPSATVNRGRWVEGTDGLL